MLLLLLLLELLKQFLICFELEVCDHLVLVAGLKFVLLLPLDSADLFLDLSVLVLSELFLLGERCLNCRLDGPDVLQPRLPLQLVQSDALLQQLLHLSPHLSFPFGFSSAHSIFLQPQSRFLLHNLGRLAFEID